MKIEQLLASLPDRYGPVEKEYIERAYKYAEAAHSGQKRASGEPYITHCVAVASILVELHVPAIMIAVALLHDTVEDTNVTLADLQRDFSDEVAKLVDGVTKLTNLPNISRDDQHAEETQTVTKTAKGAGRKEAIETHSVVTSTSRKRDLASETLRKTFLAMGEDVRVILIKLADRLHNMRTLGYVTEAKRKRIAEETMEIFAPLANRLGLWQMKWELEDLSFRYMNPEQYKSIAEKLAERRVDRENQISEITSRLQSILKQAGIKAEIYGRPKHIYSINKKMIEKGRPFEMVRDLRAVRLIVEDTPTCYAALGVIHTTWRPIPHEFDDYIAAPKDNFYQSLHTAVIYDDGKPLEVQIRTHEMHQNAEYGIAAHWRYKEGTKPDQTFDQRVNWLRNLMEWRQDVDDAQDFMDGMKTDVFQDRVYVFTPRGDIIDLPNGATPIDFAYHVHTEIGHRCRGAKVDGKLVTLDYTLVTGNQVTILTAKTGGPSRDWLNPTLGLVHTQRARSKIRQWFKWQDRELNLSQGRSLLEREFRRLGLDSVNVEELAKQMDLKTPEDLHVALGCGDLHIGRVINKLAEMDKGKVDELFVGKPSSEIQPSTDAITVLGLKGILTSIGRCCNPVPGDDIIGYITRGRGATIHRRDCPNVLRRKDHERLVNVSWGEIRRTFAIPVEIKAYDRQGLMGDISNILNDESVNLADINLKFHQNLAVINMIIEVTDITQLSRILTKIEILPNVLEAHRLKPG
ncbi:MAG: bifunctional (p)ppGpp synthetase/guanosine-3',5'-bis(diphosphate) 3'-pyrophosphohydrolase [Anaerolineaceae bacterium]|nr:bifunctional (p)ppGpp synthetase/guanosine-3',5'-bis(diphosphate) 3'-pyrophosphohydrolase [Anaerolineaceae bacterium]MBN2678544.1 bifunctional (p)ppGpp synthetase/guanosine-3',5'-bis(diphosphate) 3'-pyrophosphohydrolase [Anaerolineaceae bacterium]